MTSNEQGSNGSPLVLLIANRTCPCPDVLSAVGECAGETGRVHVVAPALNSRLRHLVSDVDDALEAARDRLESALEHLRGDGVEASGEVGDSDPMTAASDAMAVFAATEIVVSTYPEGDSNWLEQELLERLETAFDRPVTHLVSRYGL